MLSPTYLSGPCLPLGRVQMAFTAEHAVGGSEAFEDNLRQRLSLIKYELVALRLTFANVRVIRRGLTHHIEYKYRSGGASLKGSAPRAKGPPLRMTQAVTGHEGWLSVNGAGDGLVIQGDMIELRFTTKNMQR